MSGASVRLSNGRDMPCLGLGTWRGDATLLHDAVCAAVKAGYRHIDTASLYFNEGIVGAALQQCMREGVVKREELFITSKLMPTDMHAPKVQPAVRKSVDALGCGPIDLYLIHWPFRFVEAPSAFPVPVAERLGYTHEAVMAVWRELEAAVDAGLLVSLGVSNFSRKKLGLLLADARLPPVVNQLELHPLLVQAEVCAWHREHGVVVTGYCPLGSPSRPPTFRHADDPEVDSLSSPIVRGIAAQHGKSPAQVLLKWAVQRGTVPLPKSTTPARIEENYGGVDPTWSLSGEDMELVSGLDTGHRYNRGAHFAREGEAWADLWDGDVL